MKAMTTAVATVLVLTVIGGSVFAQAQDPAPQVERHTRMKNPIVAASGLFAVIFGAAFAIPGHVGDNWVINGNRYCDHSTLSTNTIDIQSGSCAWQNAVAPKLGYALLAAGGGMMIYGFQRVEVAPSLGRNVIGATATVKW